MLRIEFRKVQYLKEADEQNSEGDKAEEPASPSEAPAAEDNGATSGTDKTVKEKIVEKVTEIWGKVKTWFQNILMKVLNKIREVFWNDSKVMNTYKEALSNKDNLTGFPGIKNYRPANLEKDPPVDDMQALLVAFKNGSFLDNDFKTKCDQAIAKSKELLGEAKDWGESDAKAFDFNKAIEKIASKNSYQKSFALYKSYASISPDSIKGTIRNKILATAGKEMAGTNDVSIQHSNMFTAACKEYISNYVGYFKALRHAIIVCGSYAAKKAKGAAPANEEEAAEQSEVNAAYTFAVELQSESYLDEQFSFV